MSHTKSFPKLAPTWLVPKLAPTWLVPKLAPTWLVPKLAPTWLAFLVCFVATPSSAAVLLERVLYSADVPISVDGLEVNGPDLVDQEFGGAISVRSPLGLPPSVEIVAAHLRSNGELLLSFDTSVTLPGLLGDLTALPGEVVAYAESGGGSFTYRTIFVDSFAGVPAGVSVDAVSEIGTTLYLSFDTTATLGIQDSIVADDEDVVAYDPLANRFVLALDLSREGIDPSLDLDALHVLPPMFLLDPVTFLLSFDGSGSIDGISFDDEDVLYFVPGPGDLAGQWNLVYDGSAIAPQTWATADLDAFYGVPLQLSVTPLPSFTPTVVVAPTETPTVVVPPSETPTEIAPTASPTRTADEPVATATPTRGDPTATQTGTPATPSPTATRVEETCAGDCDGNGSVSVAELVRAVNIALELAGLETCAAADRNDDGEVSVSELIAAVNRALFGCSE